MSRNVFVVKLNGGGVERPTLGQEFELWPVRREAALSVTAACGSLPRIA
jgi:hypothetical protein